MTPALRHGFHGIENQIQQALLQHGVIAPGRKGSGRQFGLHPYGGHLQLMAGQQYDGVDHLMQVDLSRLDLFLAGEGQQGLYDFAAAQRLSDRQVQVALETLHPFGRQGVVPQMGKNQLVEGDDAGDGIVDLVADRCHQATQGGQPVFLSHPRQIVLDGPGAVFDMFAEIRGDVADDFDILHDIPQHVEQGKGDHLVHAQIAFGRGDFMHGARRTFSCAGSRRPGRRGFRPRRALAGVDGRKTVLAQHRFPLPAAGDERRVVWQLMMR